MMKLLALRDAMVNQGSLKQTLAVALMALAWGCGGDGSSGTDAAGTDSGSTGTATANDPDSTEGADCEGAFASLTPPHIPNTSLEPYGGFIADDEGIVFSTMPDPTHDAHDREMLQTISAADMSGTVQTLYTAPDTAMVGKIFSYEDDLYFALGLFRQGVFRMPRAGGEAEQITDGGMSAGPVSDGSKLYYAVRPILEDSSIVALDMATGEEETLTDRGASQVVALTVEEGTLYWLETEGSLAEVDYSLYRMPASGGNPELAMELPSDTATSNLRVVDDVAFASTLTDGYDLEIHRTEFGGSPKVVEDRGGMPMVIDDGKAYYNSSSGLIANSLTFDDRQVVEGSAGMGIAAIATSSSHVWYTSGSCIYRAPK